MTTRVQNEVAPALPHRKGWWTGDVWRTLLAIMRFRPELKVLCLDAQPTGLVIISGLNDLSRELSSKYEEIVSWMMQLDLKEISIDKFFHDVNVESTGVYMEPARLRHIVQ